MYTIEITTDKREQLIDITGQVIKYLTESGVSNGILSVYAQGATGAIMIQENWDDSVQTDVVNLLRQLIPKGVWLHDKERGYY
jgi:secondary thiamine-phosphate synthase enzyme